MSGRPPHREPVRQTSLDFGYDEEDSFVDLNKGLDENSLGYIWGWYWYLVGSDNCDYLLKTNANNERGNNKYIQMGYEDARGSYELFRP